MDISQIAIRKFTGNFATTPSVSGAKIMDLAEDAVTGRLWECTDDTPGSIVWARRTPAAAVDLEIPEGVTPAARIEAIVADGRTLLYLGDASQVPEALQGTTADLVIYHGLDAFPAVSIVNFDTVIGSWVTLTWENITHSEDRNWLSIPGFFSSTGESKTSVTLYA